MFKAGLVENNQYYVWRRRVLMFGFPFALSMGFTSHILTDLPVYWVILAIITIIIIYFEFRIQKKFKEFQPEKLIEIKDKNIILKNKNGAVIREIQPEKYENIEISLNAKLPDDSFSDLVKNIRDGYSINYIKLSNHKDNVVLNFVIDSFYMIEQLKKTAQHWKSLGYNINLVLREN
ncbi:MAG: hypothetical protein IPM42_08455 [Saprospiraceae bacterium]|nr:hypothetical protein [Saprospiraceae bacterium]